MLRVPACALVTLALSGCGTIGAYTTPRTLAPGDVSGGAATELGPALGKGSTSVTPSFIAEIRVGVVDRLDVGVRTNDSDSLGVDAKLWLVKSSVFDLAFAGGFDTYLVPGILEPGTSYATRVFAGPIVGLNLTRTVSVTAWYAITRLDWTGPPLGEIDGTGQWAGQGGLGVDIRITPHFAIHPGVALVYWGHDTDDDREWGVMYGVGFAAGRLPRFDDPVRR